MVAASLFATQIALLFLAIKSAAINSRDFIFYRYFNPFGFLAMFYGLFFLLPQAIGIFNNYNMIGFPIHESDTLKPIFIRAQAYLVIFLLMIATASIITAAFLKEPRSTPQTLFAKKMSRDQNRLLIAFFLFGMIGLAYLAQASFNLTGFRSDLVKTTPGLIATAISFFANFAFALLFSQLISNKKFLTATIVLLTFGTAIMITGARGRLLWPIAISAFIIIGHRNKLNILATLSIVITLIVILSILDPLRAIALGSSGGAVDFADAIIKTFTSRNFDGFANFALILDRDSIKFSGGFLLSGIREVFMLNYFHQVYVSGVAFGSTFPGYFYLSGGPIGFIFLSLLYGLTLSFVGIAIRRVQSPFIITSYMFMAIWYTAVGGDAVESINKMITAGAPGFLALFFFKKPLIK